MKSLKRFVLISIIFPLGLNAQIAKIRFTKSDRLLVFNPNISQKTKRIMQDIALANNSTAPNYIVFIATNQLTGKTKEICTEAPFLLGALDRNKSKAAKSNDGHYYFDTKEALNNISFDSYNYSDLLLYGKKKEVRNVLKLLSNNYLKLSYNFQGTDKEQAMFAHILFNNGIMSTRGDIAGNFMTLHKMKK